MKFHQSPPKVRTPLLKDIASMDDAWHVWSWGVQTSKWFNCNGLGRYLIHLAAVGVLAVRFITCRHPAADVKTICGSVWTLLHSAYVGSTLGFFLLTFSLLIPKILYPRSLLAHSA
uniref:Uncharacterized protein n=1 Tax=Opuntia streptacantha TaxID=393608 RepID=A0A7C8YSK5_OPUST